MVELRASVYDGEDDIPFANASIVTFDNELSNDPIVVPMVETLSVTSPSDGGSAQAVYEAPPVIDISLQTRESSDGATSSLNTQEASQELAQEQSSSQPNIPKAAAAGGAVMGMFLGGPFLSLVLGVGSHHYSKQEGAVGDCARALGEVSLVAKEKFQQVNNRHHLVDKSKEAAARTLDRVQQADQEHKIQEKVGYFVSHCYAVTLDFIYRHNLIERSKENFKKLMHCLTEAVREHHHRVNHRENRPHMHHHHPHHHHCPPPIPPPPRRNARCY
ncbi:unnamed protein product [Cylindrotheca closterium]|uniref:Uncharacterized protein n=1 Tax=Cylindrotheca closterium TaxID=2856 RepID=A0AAD2JH27_9STRA|nr:unnamed protein product [Cylindrotheca closterium]